MLNGMVWILRTGAPWRDLPERYGNGKTVSSRFRRWRDAGIWDRILLALQHDGAHDGEIDGSRRQRHSCAPAGGGGAKTGAVKDEDLGRSRGGWGSTLHLVTERGGKPMVVALTAGQRHERPQAMPLLERSLDRMWPDAVAGDKGYSATDLREWLAEREIAAVIPTRDNEDGPNDDDRAADRERPIIERTINRRKRFRRIASRDEQQAGSYLAMVTLACMLELLWLCRQTLGISIGPVTLLQAPNSEM